MIVLVTGCRSGFGLLTAVEAARRGHTVYAGLRDLDTADALVETAQGLDVTPVQLDVTSARDRDTVVAAIVEAHGRLDALVNNAGVALGGAMEQLDEDELRKVFDVNVLGLWALTKAVLPTMRAQGSGTIIQVSSVSGRMAMPGLGAYAASKFALEGMSEAWRHELKPFGIRMAVVEPGPFKTDIWGRNRALSRHALDPESPYAPMVQGLEAAVARIAQDRAEDPTVVSNHIADLLERPGPLPAQQVLGRAGWLRVGMKQVLPRPVLEWLVQRAIRPKAG